MKKVIIKGIIEVDENFTSVYVDGTGVYTIPNRNEEEWALTYIGGFRYMGGRFTLKDYNKAKTEAIEDGAEYGTIEIIDTPEWVTCPDCGQKLYKRYHNSNENIVVWCKRCKEEKEIEIE